MENYGDLLTPSVVVKIGESLMGKTRNACTNGQIEKYDGPMITVAVTNWKIECPRGSFVSSLNASSANWEAICLDSLHIARQRRIMPYSNNILCQFVFVREAFGPTFKSHSPSRMLLRKNSQFGPHDSTRSRQSRCVPPRDFLVLLPDYTRTCEWREKST